MDIFTIACASPPVALGNPVKNADSALSYAHRAVEAGANILLLPHNQLTGETLGDMERQSLLLESALRLLTMLAESAADLPLCVVTSLPVRLGLGVAPCAALLCGGEIVLHPLADLPEDAPRSLHAFGKEIALHEGGFCDKGHALVFGFEREGEISPVAARRPYPLMLRPQARPWLMDNGLDAADYARRYGVTVAVSNGGLGESTADFAWRQSCCVCDARGDEASATDFLTYEVDMQAGRNCQADVRVLPFEAKAAKAIGRQISPRPFLDACGEHPERVVDIAAQALSGRLAHVQAKGMVLGISGGIDSTLALLICVKAAELSGLPARSILGVTMPGFGTSQGTHENALRLMKLLDVEIKEISIVESVRMHFRDIGQSLKDHDTVYENGQARERAQIWMDLANKRGAIAIGTGDMSELAMGFTTLGGDHLSMYGVLGGIPKTVARAALEVIGHTQLLLREVLRDILDTPVSPELLPLERGKIMQRTEEILGPYAVLDFYLYHMLYDGMAPEKLLFYALRAFRGQYDRKTLVSTLKTFIERFFAQQYKRNFLPDGPAIFSRSFSPRAGFQMPSDMDAALWLEQADALK